MTAHLRDLGADNFVFPEPDLRAAFDAVFGPHNWDQPQPFDAASAECEAPEPTHPRFDDPDQFSAYHYRDEVSSA
jgi:hypothetical protein